MKIAWMGPSKFSKYYAAPRQPALVRASWLRGCPAGHWSSSIILGLSSQHQPN